MLSVAGFDPSSGAGVTADIKTIAAHGCYGVTCITAYTVQSTTGVRRVEAVPAELLRESLTEIVSDVEIAAVRIGMLGSAAVAEVLTDFLSEARLPNVVLDPVVRSSSGASLLTEEGIVTMRERMLRLCRVITPNVDEAGLLTGLPVRNVREMEVAASALHSMGADSVVVTGGHLEEPVDVLSTTSSVERFGGVHIESRATHGTGCAFATAVACNLANGLSVRESVLASKGYVREAMERAYPIGKGKGPLNHLFRRSGRAERNVFHP